MAGEERLGLGSAGRARDIGTGRGPERNHQGGAEFVDCVRMVHVARGRYQVFRLLNVHYDRARDLIARHGLRSLDPLERLLLQVTRRNDARGYERFRDLFEAIVAYNE